MIDPQVVTTESEPPRSKPIKIIAILAVCDPENVSTWSGIPNHLAKALVRRGADVVYINASAAMEPRRYRWYRSIYWRLGLGWFLADAEPELLKLRGDEFYRKVVEQKVDAVISIHETPIASRKMPVPSILLHDCTFPLLVNFYNDFSRLSKRSVKNGVFAYRKALAHCDVAVFSSQWAADSAVADFGHPADRAQVIEFGANLDSIPSLETVGEMINKRVASAQRRFLFIGVDWNRKGGMTAVDLVRRIRSQGIDAVLQVVGCDVPPEVDCSFIQRFGFLSKSVDSERRLIENLYINSHFLVVPSHAECYGCVYCEANAFGLPVIGRDVGGVRQIIRENVNGWLLDDTTTVCDGKIASIVQACQNQSHYRSMASGAREEYDTRLNWDRAAKKLIQLIDTVAEAGSKSTPHRDGIQGL